LGRLWFAGLGVITAVAVAVIGVLASIRTTGNSSQLTSLTGYLTWSAAAIAGITAVVSGITAWVSSRNRSEYRSRITDIVNTGVNSPDAVSQANPDELIVARYIVDREAAERRLAAYLPANPRRAKRLINHERLYRQIGESRGIFGGDPELTYDHIARWALIVEEWPRLGAALTSDPAIMRRLETAADVTELQQKLDTQVPAVKATDELFKVLCEDRVVRLSPVLARLVRFEPAAPLPETSAV
jgi:hypothetical protein